MVFCPNCDRFVNYTHEWETTALGWTIVCIACGFCQEIIHSRTYLRTEPRAEVSADG